MASLGLQEALEAGAVIAGERDGQYEALKAGSGQNEAEALRLRLCGRLQIYNRLSQRSEQTDHATLFEVQSATGDAALEAIRRIEQASCKDPGAQDVPIFGSRDIKVLVTLSSIVANWRVGFDITAFDKAARDAFSTSAQPKLQELNSDYVIRKGTANSAYSDARRKLSEDIRRLEPLLAPTANVREQVMAACSVSALATGMRLGWGPSAPGGRCKPDDNTTYARQFVSNLLRKLPTGFCLKILSSAANIGGRKSAATWIRHTTEMLFAAQLLRPDGVMALLRNTFDAADDNERGLMKKLVSVGQLLSSPPQGMPTEQFAAIIAPRLLEIIAPLPAADEDLIASHHSSHAQKNAAAFALARLNEVAHDAVTHVLSESIFRFLDPTYTEASDCAESSKSDVAVSHVHLSAALELLAEVVNQSEPSSGILVDLLSPVAVALFVISDPAALEGAKIRPVGSKGKGRAEVNLTDIASDLFRVWLRLADFDAAMPILSPLSSESLFKLEGLPAGTLSIRKPANPRMPALKHGDEGLQILWRDRGQELRENRPDISKGMLDIRLDGDDIQLPTEWLASLQQRPSPSHLASCLKGSQRKDLASALLVDLLDAYTLKKQEHVITQDSSNLLQGVLHIQHILQLIETFGSECLQGDKSKMLAFIIFALGKGQTGGTRNTTDAREHAQHVESEEIPFIRPASGNDALAKLANVTTNAADSPLPLQDQSTDIDDDDGELIETALSLLLSLLESDPLLNVENYSMLHIITDRVQRLTTSDVADIRSLAKEAALVLRARKSMPESEVSKLQRLSTPKEKAMERGRAKYQEALKLLQDPILPVRAHGLVVLKELAACGTAYSDGATTTMDPALIPAILDILIQAICDDESFLYLNAVKGLAEMGNTGGKTMIRQLMSIYLASMDISSRMTEAEVDKRLRVGEAMLQIIQKLDQALSAYVMDIVPPLLVAIRKQDTPTTLQMSMLSILGTCIEACPNAMSLHGHAAAITDAMLDLLSVETDSRGMTNQVDMDNALATDAKLPHLRRAALHLLSLLLRGSSMRLQHESEQRQGQSWNDEHRQLSALRMPGGSSIQALPGSTQEPGSLDVLFPLDRLQRLHTIVSYVAQTDSDGLSRHQAEEVLQDQDTLKLHVLHSGL
jgi:hypothetical protein